MKTAPRLLAGLAFLMVPIGYAAVYKSYHYPGQAVERVDVFATDFPGTHLGLILVAVSAVLTLVNGARKVPHPRIRGAAIAFGLVACAFQVVPVMDWTARTIEPGLGMYAQVGGAAAALGAALLSRE